MNAQPVRGAAEIASGIAAAWAESLTRRSRAPAPHPYVYASGWRACDRRLVYDMTLPMPPPPYSAETLAKFRRGEDRERDLLTDLTRVGRETDPPFTVAGQQERFELRDRQGRVAIVGKVDARIEVDGVRAPLEIKAWSPMLVDSITTFADLFNNPWTRSGGYQLLAYLYGASQPFGFLLLDRSGLPLLLPVELDAHLDRIDDFLTRAERALDHVRDDTIPAPLDTDASECRRCPWLAAPCQPTLSTDPARVLIDPELEAMLEQREGLKEAGKQFAQLDRDIKARLRGVEAGVIGHFFVQGSWGKTSRVEVPAPLRAQYTITDPHGRFTLEITRL